MTLKMENETRIRGFFYGRSSHFKIKFALRDE